MTGILWTAVALLGGIIADADLPDVDVDVPGDVDMPNFDFHVDHAPSFDHGSVDVSPLSPITLASFITSFGGLGIIATQLFYIPENFSLIFATIGATLIAAGMFLFYSRVLVAGQGSSEIRMSEISGKKAQVIIPIPENGLGQVAITARGTRTTRGARSVDGKAIPRGVVVTIQTVTGNSVIVSR